MHLVTVVAARVEGRGEDVYAVFDLSHEPRSEWIRHFEKCLAKHSDVAVVVADRCVRAEVAQGVTLRRVRQLVERCAEEANFAEANPSAR